PRRGRGPGPRRPGAGAGRRPDRPFRSNHAGTAPRPGPPGPGGAADPPAHRAGRGHQRRVLRTPERTRNPSIMTSSMPAFRPRRGQVLFAVAGTAAVLAAAACSSSGSGGSTVNVSSVTLTIGDQKGTGAEALLQAAGLLSKLPFKVKWVDFTSGPPMVQAMGAGSVDIGGVGDAPPAFAAAGGSKIKIVGARITPAAAGAVVVPKGSSITSVQQLKGKTIAAPEGTSADYHLLTVLAAAGLTRKDVTVDNLQPADALAAFQSGRIDAWDTWSPYIEEAVKQNGGKVLASGKQYGAPYAFQVASDAALADKGKAAAIADYEKVLNQAY